MKLKCDQCDWVGTYEEQDALGSEVGCCPNCGNEDLIEIVPEKLLDEEAEEKTQEDEDYVSTNQLDKERQ